MESQADNKLLIVEDDTVLRERLVLAFQRRGYLVHSAESCAAAHAALDVAEPPFTHALLDQRLDDGSGLELIAPLQAHHEAVRIVVLTGYGSIATAVRAVQSGATHYLSKPADADDIEAAWARHERGEAAADTNPAERGKNTEQRTNDGQRKHDDQRKDDDQVPSLARVEWEHIHRVLEDTGGNISLTAKRLGLHRRSLQRKLAKFPQPR